MWYLGIDFGTTGLSATLLNAKTRYLHPISWSVEGETESLFRLPAEVAFSANEQVEAACLIGLDRDETNAGIILRNFKPYLKVALPYPSFQTGDWEPIVQLSDEQPISLYWLRYAAQTILETLKLNTESAIAIAALDLEPETLSAALNELGGIIISCPAGWSEAYRFNMREAILAVGLVETAEQISFVSEAIASALAKLIQNNIAYCWGDTLIIHAGATTTEIALADLPPDLTDLTHDKFACRSFAYAGNFIDQDIICQLLLTPEYETHKLPFNREQTFLGTDLHPPLPGEPDLNNRYKLQQRIESSKLGKTLLEAAKHLKLTLAEQETCTLELEQYRWEVAAGDLESRVYSPFIQCLNRELNALLVRQGKTVESIRQAICTGGTGQIGAIALWLRQKLPNATIVGDTDVTAIATGLAALPLYPHVLDVSQHQYSDYFLLLEVLRTCGEQPFGVGKLTQLLERRGINTNKCRQCIVGFLEGHLPAGIVPTYADALLLTESSRHMGAIASNPIFEKIDNQTYRLNVEQSERLRYYLKAILDPSRQKLEEPLGFYWLTPSIE